ncbi:signal-transducing adaptor protein 1-like [Scomber scombrus]|uniref:signal-transducing adaptor protein 1-like n=1 Tax=Scomber scombrus TaxID=13677 RepID=UPI002DDC1301|nr:signal-transducing adaptor protein 1-like [Scomber scombrus]
MFGTPRVVVHKRRATITALPLYYFGTLLKKQSNERDFRKYYAELRGATLFLYTDDKHETYTEKLDLEQMKSMTLDAPYQKKMPTIFTLSMQKEDVQLKMENPDKGEEWRCYILTVVRKEIPCQLQLLPGQVSQLQDVLSEERNRNSLSGRPALPPRPPFLSQASASPPPEDKIIEKPKCFFNVSRKEAEKMLEDNPQHGGLILRPSALTNNYALTLRQLKNSGSVTKNYRVTSTNSGFVIEVETPVTVSSLNDVVKYFLDKTEYRVQPYTKTHFYDLRIEPSPAPECVNIDSAPKPLPRLQVAPMKRSQTHEEPLSHSTKDDAYVVPDVIPDVQDLKIAQLNGELKEVVKLRRENTYVLNNEDKGTVKKEKTTGPAASVGWSN